MCTKLRQGINTAAAHQHAQRIVERSPHQRPQTPRQAFIQDLQSFIQQIQHDGEDVILAGNFNEDITTPDAGMNQLATTYCLVDLFSLRLGTTKSPSTYQRGSRRIDYLLMSPSLLPAVKAAGYDPVGYLLPSDHRGMYVDFDTDELFDHTPPQITSATKRGFCTSSPGVIQKYIAAKTQYLKDHRFLAPPASLRKFDTTRPRVRRSTRS